MHSRWYEQDIELNEVVNFIQTLDEEDRFVVAHHLLQIIINECDINIDEELSKFANKDYSFKRWYDKNRDLFSAFELLKDLPKKSQVYVVKRFLTSIIMSFAKKEE